MADETLGEAVRRLREAKGWSQRDLAAKALVTGAYVAMLETGAKRRASVAVLRRLERALGTPFGTLAGLAHLPQTWWRAEAAREGREGRTPPSGTVFHDARRGRAGGRRALSGPGRGGDPPRVPGEATEHVMAMDTTVDTTSPVHEARAALIAGIAQNKRGELSIADLYALADAYRAAIKAHGRAIGRTLPVPSRAYVIRALS